MKRVLAVFALAVVVSVGAAYAVPITVDGITSVSYPSAIPVPNDAPWGPNGYPGDSIGLQSYTDNSFALTPGTSTQTVNQLLWTINYTYGGTPEPWPDITMPFTLSRNITIDGVTGLLTQAGSLLVNYYNDYISVDAGPTLTLLVDGYQVDITPLALATVAGSNFDGSNPWLQPNMDLQAQFTVTAVPEPVSMVMLGCLGTGMLAARRLRKHKS